jgi:integrase
VIPRRIQSDRTTQGIEGIDPPDPRWNKENWKKRFKTAVKLAGLPTDVVPYNLRHAAISEFIMAGMDVYVVATVTGTSVDMIQRYYGHLRHDRTRELLDKAVMVSTGKTQQKGAQQPRANTQTNNPMDYN